MTVCLYSSGGEWCMCQGIYLDRKNQGVKSFGIFLCERILFGLNFLHKENGS